MATETDPVIVRIIANQRDLEKSLAASVRAVDRTAATMEKRLAGIGGGKATSNVVQFGNAAAKSTQQATQAAGQLSFQLNDIATSLSGGASPFQVMMQQGSQVAQVMQGIRAQGGSMGQVVAGAFASMLNPISLVSFALIAVAGYALQYFTNVEDGSKKAADDLSKHADTLEKMAKDYGDIIPELERLAKLRRAEADAAGAAEAKETALDEAYANSQKTVDQLAGNVEEMIGTLQMMGAPVQGIEDLRGAYDDLDEATKAHTATSKDAQPVIQVLDGIIKNGTGLIVEQARAIREKLIRSYVDLDEAAASAGRTMQQSLQFSMPGAGGPLDLGPLTGQNRVDLLNKSLGDAADAIDSFVEHVVQAESGGAAGARNPNSTATGAGQFLESTWLDMIQKYFPEQAVGKSRQQILDLRTDAELSRRAIRAYATENARDLRDAGQEVTEATLQLAHFLGSGGALKILQAAPGTRVSDIPGMGAAVAANPTILGGGATREDVLAYANRRARAPTRQREENRELEDWLKLSQEQLDLKNKQLDIDAQFWESEARRKAQMEEQKLIQEGLNAAVKQYGTVTDEMRTKIEAAAHAQAFASVASEEAAEKQKQFADQQKENAKAQADFAQQINQMAQSAIGGLINDLRNGVSAGEAFNNMLSRILDSLIQMSIQSLFSPAGGGGIGGWLSTLLGGAAVKHAGGMAEAPGPVRMVRRNTFAGAKRYAGGGFVGVAPGEIPIIAHRGELIIPKGMMGRVQGSAAGGQTNVNNQLGPVSIDMSGTGTVAAGTDQARQFGENVRRIIQVEMMRESRPGGLLRAQPGAR